MAVNLKPNSDLDPESQISSESELEEDQAQTPTRRGELSTQQVKRLYQWWKTEKFFPQLGY